MIPYTDLEAQHERLYDELMAALSEVLKTRQFILGPQVAAFEKSFAEYCGVEHAIAVNSGTSALHLALLAAGVKPGDDVITTPFTFVASVASIVYCQARPVLVDIDPKSFTIDVEQIEKAITPRTRAIMPVHLYGQCAEMQTIQDIAARHGLQVIEDAAQAHGAEYKGKRAGSFGDAGCFSFYPTKNLGACGEGGLVTTNNAEMAREIRLLRDWGQDRKYHHTLHAYNYRMEGMQGAILGVKMKYLEEWTEGRRRAACVYDRLLAGADVIAPPVLPGRRHVYHTYTVRSNDRDALQRRLTAAGIQSAIHYAIPAHLQAGYRDLVYAPGPLVESERAAREVLSLPMFPGLTEEQIETVAGVVHGRTR